MQRSDTSIEICDTRFFTLGNMYWMLNPSSSGTNKQNANQSVFNFFTEMILSKISLNVSNQNGTITAKRKCFGLFSVFLSYILFRSNINKLTEVQNGIHNAHYNGKLDIAIQNSSPTIRKCTVYVDSTNDNQKFAMFFVSKKHFSKSEAQLLFQPKNLPFF